MMPRSHSPVLRWIAKNFVLIKPTISHTFSVRKDSGVQTNL